MPLPIIVILALEAAAGVYVLVTGVRSHWRARRRERRGFDVVVRDGR